LRGGLAEGAPGSMRWRTVKCEVGRARQESRGGVKPGQTQVLQSFSHGILNENKPWISTPEHPQQRA
jgi:hypothetical protein